MQCIFSKGMVLPLDAQELNINHFPADRQVMLGGHSDYRYVDHTAFLINPQFQALSEQLFLP